MNEQENLQKALERLAPLNDKVYNPTVDVGQAVYLRHRPVGRNKIQDAWAPTVHRVIEVQGTTYTVEPLEGAPVREFTELTCVLVKCLLWNLW